MALPIALTGLDLEEFELEQAPVDKRQRRVY